MPRIPSHVFSTATSTIRIPKYSEYVPNQVPQELSVVVIHGGANVPDKFLRTPKGVATPITADQYDFLMSNRSFSEMMAKGFFSFGYSEGDADRAAADMTAKDRSAPKTDDDYRRTPNNTGGMGISVGRSAEQIATS